jgi:hypothetical protein
VSGAATSTTNQTCGNTTRRTVTYLTYPATQCFPKNQAPSVTKVDPPRTATSTTNQTCGTHTL